MSSGGTIRPGPKLRRIPAEVWATPEGHTLVIWLGVYGGSVIAELIWPAGGGKTVAGPFSRAALAHAWAEGELSNPEARP